VYVFLLFDGVQILGKITIQKGGKWGVENIKACGV